MRIGCTPGAAAALALALASPAFAGMRTTTVEAQDGRTCGVQLRIPEGEDPLPIVVGLNGTGIYAMADDDALPFQLRYFTELLGTASALTIDKPGLSLRDGAVHVDDAVYDAFVQTDLALCLDRAIRWATTQPEARYDGRLALVGHSEGAMVLVRAMDLTKASAWHEQVRVVVLSGLPLEPFGDILADQYPRATLAKVWRAARKRDDDAVRAVLGLGSAYLLAEDSAPSVLATLHALADAPPAYPIQVFHGLADANVSAAPVRELERWNAARLERDQPALRLGVRYYEAGHGLNRAAVEDTLLTLDAALFD